MALRKLGSLEAQSAIERFVDHPKAWVRREARRALIEMSKKQTQA